MLDSADSTSLQSETQEKLDIIASEILVEANERGGHLAAMTREERDQPPGIPVADPRGKDFNMRWIASMVADVHLMTVATGLLRARTRRRPGTPGLR
jgi:fructose-1,6-bisphosphatase